MSTEVSVVQDRAALAESLRALARRAHRAMSVPGADGRAEARAVLQQIARDRLQYPDLRSGELRRWVDALNQRVEAVAAPPSGPRGGGEPSRRRLVACADAGCAAIG